MKNQNITVYLNTPLARVEAWQEEERPVTRVQGSLLESQNGGLTVQVNAMGDEADLFLKPSPVEKIFIPLHKVDFCVLD